MRFIILLITVLFLLSACQSAPPLEQEFREMTSEQNADSGDDLFRELAMRLLAPQYTGAPSAEEVQLLIGELPDNLPLELPLPDGARVLGSLVRGDTEIVLDATQSPEEVIDFYREQLTAAGWEEPEEPDFSGGFVSSGVGNGISLCQSKKGPRFSLRTLESDTGLTDVRLNLSDGRHSGCDMDVGYMGEESKIPNLVAPPGVQQWGGGGGGGGDNFYTSADVETELSSRELAKHYTEQLKAAGWTLLTQGEGESVAFSNWSFEDEHGDAWHGFFFAYEIADTEKRVVYVNVNLVE
jgi:hypothetical protein